MTQRQVLNGIKELRRVLQSEKARFAASPILLIESAGSKAVEDTCKQVQFMLAQQLGLRTAVSNSLKESAFPTVDLVNQQKELASRVGAGTVCAVGSEATVHLGKAIAQDMDELVIFPTTYPAVMACTMERSLLIDTREETIVPDKPEHAPTTTSVTLTLPDKAVLDAPGPHAASEAAFAALAYCLVRQHEKRSFDSDILINLENFAALVEDRPKDASQALATSLQLVGQGITWGFGKERRDVPLAMAASLLPKIFPTSTTTSLMASLAPHLINDENSELSDLYNRLVKTLGEPLTLVSNHSVDTLLGIIRDNQATWNCLDARKDVMKNCLRAYSLVD